MSIAVAIGTRRSVVICADRQMTDSQAGLKFEGTKVKGRASAGFRKSHNITFAYVGLEEPAKNLLTAVIEALGPAVDSASGNNLFDAEYYRQALLPVFRSKDAKAMQTLIGLQTEHRCFLFRTKAEQVVEGYMELVGGGDSSALRYFSDVIGRARMSTIEEYLAFSIYLVTLANRYVDGCGFGVDAVILEEHQDIGFLDKKDTEKYSKRFAQFERQMEEEFFSASLI